MLKSVPRVAYLSYDGLTDPLGQSQILPYILGLEEKGFEFVIISFEKAGTYMEGRSVIEGLIWEKKITWIPLMYHKNPQVLSTLFDIYFLWRTVRKEHTKNPFSILHCRSYITSLVGCWMKRNTGIKFIFDMRGFWADERVEGGLWNLKNPLYKIIYTYFKRKEREFLTQADHVVSLTENAKQEILDWRLKAGPITVIPTCVDMELFDPESINKEDQKKVRTRLGIQPDDFVLLYLGSWGTWYLTNEMLSFFTEIKERYPNAKFLIVSTDDINLSSHPLIQNVLVTKSTRQRIPLYISIAQVAICFIKPTFSKKASSATKLAEILAMNIPVIVNKGWGDIDELIVNLKSEVPLINLVGLEHYATIESNEFFTDHYSLSGGIKKYHTIYSKLLTVHE